MIVQTAQHGVDGAVELHRDLPGSPMPVAVQLDQPRPVGRAPLCLPAPSGAETRYPRPPATPRPSALQFGCPGTLARIVNSRLDADRAVDL